MNRFEKVFYSEYQTRWNLDQTACKRLLYNVFITGFRDMAVPAKVSGPAKLDEEIFGLIYDVTGGIIKHPGDSFHTLVGKGKKLTHPMQAWQWYWGKGEDYCTSFTSICNHLGVDVKTLRNKRVAFKTAKNCTLNTLEG